MPSAEIKTRNDLNKPFPKKNLVPLGSEYLFDIVCSCFDRTAGPQKNYKDSTFELKNNMAAT